MGKIPRAHRRAADVGAVVEARLPGNAMDVEMDGTGRILVSPELRAATGITRETLLLGMGNHFELWDKATYEAKEAEATQGEMPDVFQDFAF